MIFSLFATLAPTLRWLASKGCCQGRCCKGRCKGCCKGCGKALNSFADSLERALVIIGNWQDIAQGYAGKGWHGFKNLTMTLAFVPMLIGGMFLGTLVVVGQGSKQGFMQVLTAIVLLSDVLFKIVASAVTEGAGYLLHRRVTRIVASGENRRSGAVVGAVIGQPNPSQPPEKTKVEKFLGNGDGEVDCKKGAIAGNGHTTEACEP